MKLPQYSLRILLLIVGVTSISLAALSHYLQPSATELQVSAVNNAIIREERLGLSVSKIRPDFQFFIGRRCSDYPRVFKVAEEIDIPNYKQRIEDLSREQPDFITPEWLQIIFDYPNPSNEVKFFYLYTRRGDLSDNWGFQDHLVLCVSDGEIKDVIQKSVMEY